MNVPLFRLYLDDVRDAPSGWIQARTANEAIRMLETGMVEIASLDHDLGHEDAGTGYDVLLWVEEQVALYGFVPPRLVVHSANPAGRARMHAAIDAIRRHKETSK